MSNAWIRRRLTLNSLKGCVRVIRSIATALMAIVGCILGLKSKESTETQRQFCVWCGNITFFRLLDGRNSAIMAKFYTVIQTCLIGISTQNARIKNGWRIFPTSRQDKDFSVFRLFVTYMTIVLLPTRPAPSRTPILFCLPSELTGEKRMSLQSCSSTSDHGFPYTSQAYFSLTKSYHITPSMSRKGNPYDNALAENFFSILKTECIYRQKIAAYEQARLLISEYIHFYNSQRIQL